jgi:hypothetical protein
MYEISKTVIAAGFLVIAAAAPAMADVADVNNIADILHPDIHKNVTDGANANPNGVSPAGGDNLHGIANTPGQNGDNPNNDGTAGFANELNTVHGGIGEVNRNVLP